MKILITYSVNWSMEKPLFPRYESDVILINYGSVINEQPIHEKRKWINCNVSCYPENKENEGLTGEYYKELEKHEEELLRCIDGDEVVVLSFVEIQSLYPYKLLQRSEKYKGNLHLICMDPGYLYPNKRKNKFENLLFDLDKTKTAAFLSTVKFVEKYKKVPYRDLLKEMYHYYNTILERLENLCSDEDSAVYQFDETEGRYVQVNKLRYRNF